MSAKRHTLANGRPIESYQVDDRHTNHEHNGFCCPYCNQDMDSKLPSTSGPTVITCQEAACGKQFAAWQETVTVNKSGEIDFISLEDEDGVTYEQ